MSLEQLLSHWRAEPTVGGNVVEWRTLEAHNAQLRPIPTNLHTTLRSLLEARGVESLFSHQAAVWEQAQLGKNVVIATPTASGKTLGYNLPVLDRLMRLPESRALYLFPTKALSQDQKEELELLLEHVPQGERIPVATYDGDTNRGSRPAIRKKARLILSNPDMLHTGILPHHTRWTEYFANLHFIVIDEMHTYRGVFGSHVANVLRRLKRVASFYGANPQFILTSATIANPIDLAKGLIEERVVLVDEDGAARGPKHFLIYNPPVVNEDLGIRRSVLQESVRLADDLLTYGVQLILFGRARRTVEIMLNYLREAADLEPGKIRGYRSGYLPRQRREIESGLRSGDVRAVVATNALELGIDIGGMDAAVLAGYPGSIAATWQQAGRAGRATDASLAVLVASANPLDQFLASHPEYFFGRSPEQALINPDNLLVLLAHIRCAAYELPFNMGEGFGTVDASQVAEFLSVLEIASEVHQSGDKYFWMSDRYPAEAVSLRSASPDSVTLYAWQEEAWRVIGQVDAISANWMVHPEAIYMHEGQIFYVESLDLDENVARLKPSSVDYYTEPRSESSVSLLEEFNRAEAIGACKAYGEIMVTGQVIGYHKVQWFTHERLGIGDVDLPATELQTTGYWLALSDATVDKLREQGVWGSDTNKYGSSWKQQKNAARERDNFTCQNCGEVEDGRAHDVHHKIPFRAFASFEEANRLENLVTLCRPCHRRAESVVRVRSGLAGLAFTLSHLAPLFLMCDSRDLGVHSEPQSEFADGQPVVVIYDRVPAGIGFSERLFELHDGILLRAYELVSTCECNDGCPSCVGPGGEDGAGSKHETLAILQDLTGELNKV
ncbi:MAG: DEAD/DEAH box helicase [Chloroflexi bacterium]|nr:DEAD/DEAH box helicase [Chloroflexota bacterium]